MKCHADYHRDQRKKNPREKYKAHEVKKYQITIDVYDQMVKQQSGKCAICLTPIGQLKGRWGSLCIDHDHATGKIRGLLCAPCNKGLGHYEDNPDRLRRAAEYLLKGRD